MSIQTGIILGAVFGKGPIDLIKGDLVAVPVHVLKNCRGVFLSVILFPYVEVSPHHGQMEYLDSPCRAPLYKGFSNLRSVAERTDFEHFCCSRNTPAEKIGGYKVCGKAE